jgi:uncharacterized protein YqeY
MTIRDDLKAQSIAALKAGDKLTRVRLGGVLAKFIEAEKAAGFDGWTDAAQQKIVVSYVKQLKGALEQLGDRPLADDYRGEIELLAPYLPKMLSEAETRAIVEPLAADVRGIGQLMGMVMRGHKGKVDPALVRSIGESLGLK